MQRPCRGSLAQRLGAQADVRVAAALERVERLAGERRARLHTHTHTRVDARRRAANNRVLILELENQRAATAGVARKWSALRRRADTLAQQLAARDQQQQQR